MDEPASGTSGIDRRTLLSSLASASGIGVGFASATGGGRAAESETTIQKLTGEERERTLREAFAADETEAVLSAKLPADAEMTGAKVVRSSYEGTDWHVVAAEFESESGAEASVFWSDHAETEPAATVVEPDGDAEGDRYTVETPTAGTVPFAFNPCGDWEEMPNPDCIVETAYLYAEEVAACARCAATVRDQIDTGRTPKKLLLALARSAPSCGMCLYKMIDEYSEHGIPCELCVPEEEVGFDGEDTVRA